MEEDEKQSKIHKKDYKYAFEMNSNEKKISFLNNYFIFKKTHNVNAGQVSLIISGDSKEEVDDAEEEGEDLSNLANVEEKTLQPAVDR